MTTSTLGAPSENRELSHEAIYVSSAHDLMSALANANGGETILLKGGNYGSLSLNIAHQAFAKFAEEVIIRSAEPENPAIFSSLSLKGAENITLDGIKFDYDAPEGALDWEKPFSLVDANNITIKNSVFDGDLSSGVNDVPDGLGTGYGLFVFESSGIAIESNTFTKFKVAGFFHTVDNLVVNDNEVSAMRWDGFQFAQINNALIEGNYLHDFAASTTGDEHLDMIQFWTTSTDRPSTDITIRGNFLDSGEGSWTQSIFMRNELVDQGKAGIELYYRNIVIEDNVIFNAHTNAIVVGESIGVQIQNNTLLQNQDSDDTGRVSIPSIWVNADSSAVTVKNNIAPAINVEQTHEWTVENNLIVQRFDANQPNYVGDLFVNALVDSKATIEDLKAMPGGVIEKLDVGSSLTRVDLNSDKLFGFITAVNGDGLNLDSVTFDSSMLFANRSALDAIGATVAWDYGDGTLGSGAISTHRYGNPGTYDAHALVTFIDGRTVTLHKTVEAQTPVALRANFDEGATDLSGRQNASKVDEKVRFEEGRDGLAARLNGGVIGYASAAELSSNSQYTLLFSVKKDPGQESAGGRVISFSSTFMIDLDSDGVAVRLTTTAGSQNLRADNIGINDTNWHRVALTFSGESGSAILYVDGKEVARIDGLKGETQTGVPADFFVGNPWGNSFKGLIDDIAFLRGALTAERVAADTLGLEPLTSLNAAPAPSDPQSPPSPDEPATQDPPTNSNTVIPNVIDGTNGNDLINGTDGADDIRGHGGKDRIFAGIGDDLIYLGDQDWGLAEGGDDNDTMYGGIASDTLIGGTGNDVIDGGGGMDKLFGGNGDDVLIGGTGRDWLYGESGDDTLVASDTDYNLLDGGDGNDRLTGGDGRDYLVGGNGDDVLIGGGGSDDLTGGSGADRFMFGPNSGGDRLLDFNPLEDTLVLQGLNYQSVEQVLQGAINVRGDLIVPLDGPDATFSWSSSNYVRLAGISVEDLNHANISILVA